MDLAQVRLGLMNMVVLAGVISACSSSPPKVLTPQYRSEISSALTDAGLPQPESLEVSSADYLVATFVIDPDQLPGSIRAFGEKAVLTIRNAMYPHKVFDAFRVTVNGASPGPGLIRRYGSARFHEGGAVEWESAK